MQLVLFVLGPGCRHSFRGADADSLGPVTIAFLPLQYIDKVVDVYCAGPVSRVHTWRRQPSSHNCTSLNSLDQVVDMPVVCNDRFWVVDDVASSSKSVDVAVLPQRQVPAVGLDSWDVG